MNLPTTKVLEVDHEKSGIMIRHARTRAKVSLRRLASQMGISAPFLSDLERGRRNWTEERFWQAEKMIMKLSK